MVCLACGTKSYSPRVCILIPILLQTQKTTLHHPTIHVTFTGGEFQMLTELIAE